MLEAIKLRLYPNPLEQQKLEKAFGTTRWFWNNSLAETQKVYAETGKGLGQYSFNARLPQLKQEFPWLSETYSQVLQSVSLNLSRAFIGFFEGRTKFPNFKSKHGKQSIQYPQGVKVVEGSRLSFPKIGNIKAKIHREIVGKIKTVTLSKAPSGKYFASILTETEELQKPISYGGKIIGIDVGLTHLAITSDGSKFENPKFIRKSEINLAKKQQKLSRKKKGSNSRAKARIVVAKAHERIMNQRNDYLHKVSHKLVNENQVICVENLNVKGMMANHKLAKAISDVSWGKLTQFIKYKCKKFGKGYIEVDRFFPSSQMFECHGTMTRIKLPLDVRSWKCPDCGKVHDRDINAAINIRNEGKRMMTAGLVVTATGGKVSRKAGVKSSVVHMPMKVEAPCFSSE
jgi:putative transposase